MFLHLSINERGEEKACQGDQVELDKWNKNELNSIDKENIAKEY